MGLRSPAFSCGLFEQWSEHSVLCRPPAERSISSIPQLGSFGEMDKSEGFRGILSSCKLIGRPFGATIPCVNAAFHVKRAIGRSEAPRDSAPAEGPGRKQAVSSVQMWFTCAHCEIFYGYQLQVRMQQRTHARFRPRTARTASGPYSRTVGPTLVVLLSGDPFISEQMETAKCCHVAP